MSKVLIAEIAQKLKSYGYTVYVAERVTLESPAQHLAYYDKTPRYTEVLQCDAEKIEE